MSKKVLVVVLGDLARSPRMQNHCKSLLDHQYQVDVLATGDKVECDTFQQGEKFNQHIMPDLSAYTDILPKILSLFIKTICQIILLSYYLAFLVPRPSVILVQNPPSVPVVPVLWFYNILVRAKLVIDWHNYGYSILALKLGNSHPVVLTYKVLEMSFGRRATHGFCVSRAMKDNLKYEHKIEYPIDVLYDRPTSRFRPFSHEERQAYWTHLSRTYHDFWRLIDRGPDVTCRTPVLFSSTSWTEDEDIEILLRALLEYDRKVSTTLICVITGKGPLKAYYESKIGKMDFRHVKIYMPWLPASEYPKMVASSDLGISLHRSSSGLDLPMKIVDMLGCGIPVLAYQYDAITELLPRSRECGYFFKDWLQLFDEIHVMTTNDNTLFTQRCNIKRIFKGHEWETSWTSVVLPVLDSLVAGKSVHRE